MFRRIGLAASVTFGLVGCLATALENAPCNTNADCLGGYDCVFTATQLANGDGIGLCRPSGWSCAAGIQDGCAAGGGCAEGLETVCDDDDEACFCCDVDLGIDLYAPASSSGSVAIGIKDITSDGTSAVCIQCQPEGCAFPLESCINGSARCEVEDDDDDCGCRVREEDLAKSDCDGDPDCGNAFEMAPTSPRRARTEVPPGRLAARTRFWR